MVAVKSKHRSSTTTLLVKNMVCNRCIRVVGEELEKLGLQVLSLDLGEVVVSGTLGADTKKQIAGALVGNGFELIEDVRARTIEQIKHAILKLIHDENLEHRSPGKYSEYIEQTVGREYHSLSTLFSSVENITIEHFIILQRIERAKELLKYGELTLSEMSHRLGYSSVAHLSAQFKNITGMTPSAFKKIVRHTRTPLDKVHSRNR